jgi:2-succinyl-5-enolpyruvyl-6-hydroxy-3-cyclohexene-1-carboxylate synthase
MTAPRSGIVTAQRGVSGIDGTIAFARGIMKAYCASAKSNEARGILFCGDVTFLYDLNSLVSLHGEKRENLDIVILNDHAGGIFTRVHPELKNASERLKEWMMTPHDVSFQDVAETFCIEHTVAHNADELTTLLDLSSSQQPQGLRIIEALVATDTVDETKELSARVSTILHEVLS